MLGRPHEWICGNAYLVRLSREYIPPHSRSCLLATTKTLLVSNDGDCSNNNVGSIVEAVRAAIAALLEVSNGMMTQLWWTTSTLTIRLPPRIYAGF
jgi:hypothetical protein